MEDAGHFANVLAQTVEKHMQAILPKTPGSNDVDAEAILSNLAPEYQHDFGHSYFVSTKPHLQGEKDGNGFVQHMSGMATWLQTWDIKIRNTCIDDKRKSAVVRADFYMTPKGGQTIVNDILFWIALDESGRKLVKLTEFVDPVASAELGARMQAGMAT